MTGTMSLKIREYNAPGSLCLPKQYINSEASPIDYRLSLR